MVGPVIPFMAIRDHHGLASFCLSIEDYGLDQIRWWAEFPCRES
jgi:hypothetical protein